MDLWRQTNRGQNTERSWDLVSSTVFLTMGYLKMLITRLELANPMHTFLSCSGYMSPEYALDGVFSIKGDVFSFGLVVLGTLWEKKYGVLQV